MAYDESDMLQSYRLLREIIDTIDSGLILWDSNQRLVVWNKAMERVYPELAPLLRRGMDRDELRRLRESQGEKEVVQKWDDLGVWDRQLPDGRIIALKRLGMSDGGRLTLHTDVTEERQRNDAMIKSERMASLGRLVVGMAHELNTPVGNALLVASATLEQVWETKLRMTEGSLRRSDLDAFTAAVAVSSRIIVENLSKISALVSNFKMLASEQRSESTQWINLAEYFEHVCSTVSGVVHEAGHRIESHVETDLTIVSYPGALLQVIVNLIENAVMHAFPDRCGGEIRLVARSHGERHVEITVTDDGVGISKTNQKHIFDPFFTTQLGQGGTGLGLSVVMTMVREHLGGEIQLRSEEGQGSQFRLILPREMA